MKKNTAPLSPAELALRDAFRWSPDGRFLAFLSSRGDSADADQLWLLSRRG